MKETYQDREGYLERLSGLEKLTALYNLKPASRHRFLRSLISGGPFSLLKPVYDLFHPGSTPMESPADDLKLDILDTRERASYIFSSEEIAVYTVLFGNTDNIQEPLISPDNIHYFAITDQDLNEHSLWHKKDVSALLPEEIRDDPVLCSRWCKMHPELLFPEYTVSVYVDANILITSDLTPLTAGLEKFPVNMFRHRTRDCAYQEIHACFSQKKASLRHLMQDKKRLQKHGLPKHWGLLEAPVIARRHNDPLCCRIMDEWWKDFSECGSRRDQIALMDCLWQMQIPPEKIGILGSNVRATGMFIQLGHNGNEKNRIVNIKSKRDSMHNKKTEKTVLFVIALIFILVKIFLIKNLPIEVRRYKSDDRLMVDMAIALRSGNWLGEYKGQLLMKGPFFPMLLAVFNRIGLDYLSGLNLLNTLAALFFVSQLRGLLKNPLSRLFLFAVLLFDPCTDSQLSFQRVYRSSIVEMEVLFLWGAYYGLYIRSLKTKDRLKLGEILLFLIAGFDLWATWNTREECFWVIPFVFTATCLIGYRYWKAGRKKFCSKKLAFLRCGLLIIPFILLFSGNQIIRNLNRHYYGEAVRLEITEGFYSDALKSIYSVRNEQETELVTVTREKLDRIFAISPTLRQIQQELEAQINFYDQADRNPKNGEIEDGWFLWALKYAAYESGAADSLPKSQSFWKAVHQEVEAALDDPSSSLERQRIMPSALMSPLQKSYLASLPKTFFTALKYVFTYEGTYPLSGGSGKSDKVNDKLFSSFTNNVALDSSGTESSSAAEKLPHLSETVKILTLIGNFYRAVNPIAFIIGTGCFIVMFFRLIVKKQYKFLAPFLIISGMAASMLIVVAGVSYTHISAFDAISYHYLCGAYPLMLCSIWFAILYMSQPYMKK